MASGVASAAFTKVASFTGNPFARHGGGEVPHISTNSRILGTIFGNCAGDAIGLLTEFLVKEDAIKVSFFIMYFLIKIKLIIINYYYNKI